MWNIAIGILFVIGGLSGSMVLRGTDSSVGLAVLGVGLIAWGGFQMASESKQAQQSRRKPGTRGPTRKTNIRRK